jgi:hypothetical protein
MITVFNRRELITTCSMTDRVEIVQDLNAAGIDYRLLVENRYTRARVFTGGRQAPESAYQYTIFVHKDDLDRAQTCLSRDYRPSL